MLKNRLDVGVVSKRGKGLGYVLLEGDGGGLARCGWQTLDVDGRSLLLCLLLLLGVLADTTNELESALAVADMLNAVGPQQEDKVR